MRGSGMASSIKIEAWKGMIGTHKSQNLIYEQLKKETEDKYFVYSYLQQKENGKRSNTTGSPCISFEQCERSAARHALH